MVEDNVKYDFKEVRALRGTEARTTKKWQEAGWELVDQSRGPLLQTKFTFRRPKAKVPWRLLAIVGGLVAIIVIVGIIAETVRSGNNKPELTSPPAGATVEQSGQPLEQPSATPEDSESKAEEYSYQGPKYEIVAVDENVGITDLDAYWVYTKKLSYSTDAFKDQTKMIISDIARRESTAKLMVQVVSDKEIVEAESASTIAEFTEEHGLDYFKRVMVPKEEKHWIASYSGGFDGESGKQSDSAKAFEIIWLPYATSEIEKWQPAITD